jgi:hypothetical protein
MIATGGGSASYSISRSVSNSIHDVSITTGDTDSGVFFDFSFANFESEASRSTFSYEVQGIWEWSPANGKGLDLMPLLIEIDWTPHAWFIIGSNRFGEGDCATMTFVSQAKLVKQQIPQALGFHGAPGTTT